MCFDHAMVGIQIIFFVECLSRTINFSSDKGILYFSYRRLAEHLTIGTVVLFSPPNLIGWSAHMFNVFSTIGHCTVKFVMLHFYSYGLKSLGTAGSDVRHS
uniref:Uncharacterized protein n=1 Tax=Spongospora subterranea TaxID=70186 RepID=A0A0H5RDI5_9EUKA|eukprot:CRZ06618.1 hypothetical protein [Spongospora subterranea]